MSGKEFNFLGMTFFQFIAVILISIIGLQVFGIVNFSTMFQATEEETVIPVETAVQVKLTRSVVNPLNTSGTVAGTIALYDPADDGRFLETCTIASNSITTTNSYAEGRQIFMKFVPTTATAFFEYGELYTIPTQPTREAGQTWTIKNALEIYAQADLNETGDGTEMFIERSGTLVWDGDGTPSGVNAFNASDIGANSRHMQVRVANEDEYTCHADPRHYFDWSEPLSYMRDKKSYWLMEWDLIGDNKANVEAYGWMITAYGGAVYKNLDSENIVFFVEIDTLLKAGANNPNNPELDGTYDWLDLKIDFTGMSSTYWNDEIDIEISVASGFSMGYYFYDDGTQRYRGLSSSSADSVDGELSVNWTNDCSMG